MFVHGCGSHAPRFGAVRDDLELDGDTAARRQLGHLDGRARRQLFERAEGMIVLGVEGGKVAAHVDQVGLHAGGSGGGLLLLTTCPAECSSCMSS